MSATSITTEEKARSQGFLLLGLSTLCLLVLVPVLALAAHVAASTDTQRILLLSAFVPAIGGVALAVLGNRIISGKTKTF